MHFDVPLSTICMDRERNLARLARMQRFAPALAVHGA